MIKITKHILWGAITCSLSGCILESTDIDKITDDPTHLVRCPDDSDLDNAKESELAFIQIMKIADPDREGDLCSTEDCISKKDCCGLNGKYAEKYFLAFNHKICPDNMSCLTDDKHNYFCGIQTECSKEQTKCDNVCANTMTDAKHCGKCNSPCNLITIPHSQTVSCISGTCTAVECAKGYHKSKDNKSCLEGDESSCNEAQCANTPGWIDGECQNGRCVANKCDEDFHIFNNTSENGNYYACEKDSELRCGEPFKPCPLPDHAQKTKCRDGKCQLSSCQDNYHISLDNTQCELDTIFACGDALHDCYSETAWGNGNDNHEDNDGSCTQGQCHANTCQTGYHRFNQVVDDKFVPCQKDDIYNCGAPNIECKDPTPLCQNGKCTENCSADMTLCDSGCVNLMTDVDNCMACNNKCPERPNMNASCNGSCIYSCKKEFGDCDNDPNNGCEVLLADKHWSKCGVCDPAYDDCDKNAENGCEIKLSDYGLKNCLTCTESYTNCGTYVNNNNIVSCLKAGTGWDPQTTPFKTFCADRCNNTKDPVTYPSSEAIHHPSVCKPKQYCSRKDDPYPHYYYRCSDQ